MGNDADVAYPISGHRFTYVTHITSTLTALLRVHRHGQTGATSGSARTPCWPPPYDVYRLAS
jgi:hypothetical protein